MLTTSRVKQKSRKEEAEGTRDRWSQVFSVLTRTKRLSRQRSTYPELFTWRRRKPDKHSTNQESLSRQRSTNTELFTQRRWKPEKHSTNQESLSRQWSTNTELFTQRGQKHDKHLTKSKTSRQRRHQQKIKDFHSKKKYNILIIEARVLKSKYIKHRHQEKKYQYQDCLQSS